MRLKIVKEGSIPFRVIDEDTGEIVEDILNIKIEIDSLGNSYATILLAQPSLNVSCEAKVENSR